MGGGYSWRICNFRRRASEARTQQAVPKRIKPSTLLELVFKPSVYYIYCTIKYIYILYNKVHVCPNHIYRKLRSSGHLHVVVARRQNDVDIILNTTILARGVDKKIITTIMCGS